MSNFFEKLKKGMDIETQEIKLQDETETQKTKETEKKPEKTPKKNDIPELKMKKIEVQTKISEKKIINADKEKEELSFLSKGEEGELAIDVCQTEKDLIIQSAIAGVTSENLDISLERDVLTIKGSRKNETGEKRDYFAQECFWGPFSKEIILPVEVDPGRITAEMKNGILTIRIPKIIRENKKKITIKE